VEELDLIRNKRKKKKSIIFKRKLVPILSSSQIGQTEFDCRSIHKNHVFNLFIIDGL
jgi:hypothetical protein